MPPKAYARRMFLAGTAALGAGRALGANDRIGVGIIGVGNIGTRHLQRRLLPMMRQDGILSVVAACDIYERAKFRAKELIGLADADIHHAYEDLLARDDVDAVVVATPDHWHARMAIDAMRAGKDVYLEKPMSKTIDEARQIAAVASETGRILQVGSQWVSDPAYDEARRMIGSGLTGPIVMAQSSYSSNHANGVWQYYVDEEASPTTIDWDRFLGNAPSQPFSGERFFRWRKYWDFSGGIGTDFLYHRLAPLLFAVGPRFPVRVSAHGGIYLFRNREVPDTYSTTIEYDDLVVNIVGCSGSQAPNVLHGPAFFGQMSAISIRPGSVRVTPERLYADSFRARTGQATVEVAVDNLDQQTARTNHMLDFLRCVRTREKPIFDARFGYQVMVAIRLGVDSYRQGRQMGFDPRTEAVLQQPAPRGRGFEGDGRNDPAAPPSYQKRPIA
ncbi:MAG: Gfo/Idh/MocA family oxidoreductase [Bryobacterales bacterium]|nr:Gfo/Idh/MocA family oxidoreductase [Bryobacterales bacterium]